MNAHLQRAQAAIEVRRATRQRSDYRAPVSSRHQPLQRAMRPVGSGHASDVELYLIVSYCPGCLRGHAVDLVRDVPADMPDARELEVRQMKPWRMECAEAQA